MRRALRRLLLVGLAPGTMLLFGASGAASRAEAEPVFDAFTGENFTRDANVRVRQPAAGNDFTVHDLSFSPRLSEGAPYYGVRAGYFFSEPAAWFGLALELFHFKIVGETGDTRQVSGTRGGQPIDTRIPVNRVVQRFESSNGVSFLTLDAIARHGLLADETFPNGRLQLYGGIGAGPVFTYALTMIDGVSRKPGYELAGAGVQGLAGVRLLVFRYLGLFVEGKYTHSWLTVGIAKGGHADVTEQSAHVVGGLTVVLP